VLKLITGIIGSILIFTGCANRDLARHYLEEGKSEKALRIYKKWAKVNNSYANYTLAKFETNESKKIEFAKKAYYNGKIKAANMLETIYFNKKDYKKARYWYERADLNGSLRTDFFIHFSVIKTYPEISRQIEELKKIESIANDNIYASYALGKFYSNKSNYFYDLNKSKFFYENAYKKGDIKAGIDLALLYIYDLNNEKKGLEILKNLAQKSPKAGYFIAKAMIEKMNKNIQKLNTPCITCTFKTPYEFFQKKLYLYKYRDVYININVKPWLEYSYKRGYIQSKFYLITLDLNYDKFLTKDAYSGFTLKEAISFLNNFSNKFFKAKMILADIYYKYDFLKMYPVAKQTYIEYANIDKTDAYWHLYQYYKKYEPNSHKKDFYLDYLVSINYTPAIIEKAYNDILLNKSIEKNLNILKGYADKNDILALTYYISILNQKNIGYQNKCKLYKKLCELTPLNTITDLKIANLYEINNNIMKAATIYKFYSDLNNSKAMYKLALVYKKLCNKNKFLAYLKKLKNTNNNNIKLLYAFEVIKGNIKDNKNRYLSYVISEADNNNTKAIIFLAKSYANGYYLEFDPKRAERYYLKALKLGEINVIYNMIDMYKSINLKHKYDKKIIDLYKKAIKYKLPNAEVNLAEFYIQNNNNKYAMPLLKKNLVNPKARYLLYKVTGKYYYLKVNKNTKYGKLLLAYAKKIAKYNPRRALFYTFRAALCNTTGSSEFAYLLMKKINYSKIIENIYKKAKEYPRCINY